MSKFKTAVLVAIALMIIPSLASAQCTGAGVCTGGAQALCVNDAAAMEGLCGLEITPGGSDAYVQDNTPVDEAIYRFNYQFDPSPYVMPTPSLQIVTEVFGNIGPGFGIAARVYMKRRPNGSYLIWARMFTNLRAGRDTGRIDLSSSPAAGRVCIEWEAGATNTGRIAIAYITPETNPCPASGDAAYFQKNTTNQFWNVDGLKVGAARSTPAAATGSMYLDDFQSFRTLAP